MSYTFTSAILLIPIKLFYNRMSAKTKAMYNI